MNTECVKTHIKLLRLLLDLDVSRATMLRIINPINEEKNLDAVIVMEKQIIELLQSCKTEADVILKLDESGL